MAKTKDEALPNRTQTETLPCGHTRSQAAWLGCTEDGQCRPKDAQIAAMFEAERKGR